MRIRTAEHLVTLVKQHRRDMGWSQGKLAEMTGIAQSTISRYETGKQAPTIEQAARLLEPLCCFLTIMQLPQEAPCG